MLRGSVRRSAVHVQLTEEIRAMRFAVVTDPIETIREASDTSIVKLTRDVNTASIVEDKAAGGTRHVMVQESLEPVDEGDKCILQGEGEPIGALPRIPPTGDFRSDMRVARSRLAELDDADRNTIATIARHLRRDGSGWSASTPSADV